MFLNPWIEEQNMLNASVELLFILSNNEILVHVSQIKLEDMMLSRTNLFY